MTGSLTCQVIEISRGTTHDGPGLRTTVFLKGCPLRCLWCQNPEGIHTTQDIWWEARKCIGCLSCVDACPTGALQGDKNGLHRNLDICTLCGACVKACPAEAMTFTGQEWTLDDLLKRVLKDKDYYDTFGGGVTVSGGEPLNQYEFVTEFFRRLHEQGVHTALDTCGLAPEKALASVLPHADYVLFDIKILDPVLHKQFTGHTNERILHNLETVAHNIRNGSGKTLWIRTPLIPDATAVEANITAISRYIHENLSDVVERWEMCAFNNACNAKYEKLDQTWTYVDAPLMDQTFIDSMEKIALSSGIQRDKVVISGLVAKPK